MSPNEAVRVDDVDVSLAGIEASKCPWHTNNQLRERGRVVAHRRAGGGDAYVVTGYDDVIAAFQESALAKDLDRIDEKFPELAAGAKKAGFALTSSASKHLLNSDPPDHTRLRRLVMRAFTPRRIEALRPRIKEVVDGLLDELSQKPTPDLIEEYAFPISITMICQILGVPAEDQVDFRRWSVASTTAPVRGDVAPQVAAQKSLHDYLVAHIGKRRAEIAADPDAASDDILSAMIAARDENDDNLSDSELIGMAFLILIAGHETTVGLIGAIAHGLVSHPDQRALLLADPDLIQNAVEEFLRFEGSVQRSTLRVALEDVVIADTLIPAGSVTQMLIGSANHDPSKFENPDVIDITRDTTGHVAFGQGIHFCLGAPLARAEAQIAISSLLERFPEYTMAVDEDELTYHPTVLRALVALPVTLTPGDVRAE
ncbi:cytochrome P450 family protein [Microbacterium sp. CPCC 204701]|uniref:cytochrome P450 family protein n=1 Tax=Microbacterium sp. CPCC 204701 TaxID=2493084 RepID=UPI000FD96C45|nr:cytochrome P450 [Microbacterium sp. CPCC 204701]